MARPRNKKKKFTKHAQGLYFEALADLGTATHAGICADVDADTLRFMRDNDPEFVIAEEEAIDKFRDKVRREVYRRGVEGYEEPVFGSLGGNQGSGEIGRITRYSDRLLELAAKKADKEFASSNVSVDQKVSGTLAHVPGRLDTSRLTDDEKQILAQLIQKAQSDPTP